MYRIISAILLLGGACAVCPKGWETYLSNCYLISTALESFGGAQAICQSLGAHLVSIEDDQEDNFLLKQVRDKHDPQTAYWSGGNDLEIEAEYKWLHDDTQVLYSKWAPGQPDDDESEDCVALWMPSGGLWHDADCQINYHFICEKIDESGFNPITIG